LEKKPTPHHDIPAHFYVRDTTVPDRSAEWHEHCVKIEKGGVQFLCQEFFFFFGIPDKSKKIRNK
jgi:hypothetical protein